MGVIDMVNGRLCETLPIEEIEQIRNEAYNQALEDFITEIERQTTFYCGKDSHLRKILEQLKR